MGEVSYWVVDCHCGELQPLKQITSPLDRERPDVDPISFLCRHHVGEAGFEEYGLVAQQVGREAENSLVSCAFPGF